MRRVAKLVDRRHVLDSIAAVDQNPSVARKRRWIARYGDDDRYLAGGELPGLRFSALARRIEYGNVEITQLLRHQRTAEQVAGLGLDRL